MAKLKQFLSESEITDDLKGAYTKKGDRYELNELDSKHSLVVAMEEVKDKDGKRVSEIERLTTEKSNLERDVADAKSKSLPHGYRAVTKEIAELGEAVKAAGLKSEEVANLKTKVDEYEREKTEGEKKAKKTKAAAAAGITNTDLFFNLKATDGLEFEEVDGKFLVIEGDKKTAFDSDYLKKSDAFSSVFDKLTTTKEKNTPFPETGGGEAGNVFDKIREQVSTENKTEKVDLAARFGRPE